MYSFLPATVFSLVVAVTASPLVSQVKRVVWTPPLTYPDSTTVWVAGSNYTVTWDAANQPANVSNLIASLYLRQTVPAASITLAEGFSLADGAANVTVPPNVKPASDYVVNLFGDSGDLTPEFTIVAPST